MRIACEYGRMAKIEEIRPRPDNPNSHDEEQIDRLASIIDYQGVRKPLIVSNQSGMLVTGHGTLLALKKLKWDMVPVSFQDFENEEMEYAHVAADNAIASWSVLDLSKINKQIQDMGPDFDIEMLGIRDFEIDMSDKPAGETAPELSQSVLCPGCGLTFQPAGGQETHEQSPRVGSDGPDERLPS